MIATEYEIARRNWSNACAAFRAAQKAYRARTIGDEEFLAARAEYDKARLADDVAMEAEAARAAASEAASEVEIDAFLAADDKKNNPELPLK